MHGIPEEIKAWAYSNEKIPEQDWELAVNILKNIPMICSFIEDEKCNHASFFLSSLYVFAGEIVKLEKIEEIDKLSVLLNKSGNESKIGGSNVLNILYSIQTLMIMSIGGLAQNT